MPEQRDDQPQYTRYRARRRLLPRRDDELGPPRRPSDGRVSGDRRIPRRRGRVMHKINAARAFGGPAESISVIKRWLGVPINHLVEVNFENFPQLIDAMGGVDFTDGCIVSRINGGFRNGGYTLRLRPGTHHLDGKAALAVARTRENLCAPSQTDIQRQEHQQALFNAMKSRLFSFSSFLRLPW